MPRFTPRIGSAVLALAVVALSPWASAQITITRADVLAQISASGTSSTYEVLDSEAYDDLQALADRSGGGQTWDLSSLPWENLVTATLTPVTPPVPGSDVEGLSAATHIASSTMGDSTAYVFFNVADDAYELLGIAAEVDDGDGGTMVAGLRFSPGDVISPLPLTSTSAWDETYASEFFPPMDGFSIETEVEETSAVEGWGTLVTPDGSVEVLKVRTRMVTTTTFQLPEMDPIVETDSSYIIEFVSRGDLGASISLDGEGAVDFATYSVLDREGGTAGEPTADTAFGLRVDGANPVRRGNAVEVGYTLSAPAGVRLDVFDALGRRVATLAEGARGAGPQRASLATASLPTGVYVVRLVAGQQAGAFRLTVVE